MLNKIKTLGVIFFQQIGKKEESLRKSKKETLRENLGLNFKDLHPV